jgi:hypothetical protein
MEGPKHRMLSFKPAFQAGSMLFGPQDEHWSDLSDKDGARRRWA